MPFVNVGSEISLNNKKLRQITKTNLKKKNTMKKIMLIELKYKNF